MISKGPLAIPKAADSAVRTIENERKGIDGTFTYSLRGEPVDHIVCGATVGGRA